MSDLQHQGWQAVLVDWQICVEQISTVLKLLIVYWMIRIEALRNYSISATLLAICTKTNTTRGLSLSQISTSPTVPHTPPPLAQFNWILFFLQFGFVVAWRLARSLVQSSLGEVHHVLTLSVDLQYVVFSVQCAVCGLLSIVCRVQSLVCSEQCAECSKKF